MYNIMKYKCIIEIRKVLKRNILRNPAPSIKELL